MSEMEYSWWEIASRTAAPLVVRTLRFSLSVLLNLQIVSLAGITLPLNIEVKGKYAAKGGGMGIS